MIVVDTSAWIELFRATESAADRALKRLIEDDAELAITEIVVAEVLAGARDEAHYAELREQLLAHPLHALEGLAGFERGADLYRRCRRQGVTPRGLADCLVLAPTIDHDPEVLHFDRDFDAIARCLGVRVHPLDD